MPFTSVSFWSLLYTAILGQGLFLVVVLLFIRKGNRRANRFLALMMFIFSCAIAERIVEMTGTYERWPHVLFVSMPFWYLLGPAYYFYVKNLVAENAGFTKRDLLFLVPVMIVIVRFSYFYAWPASLKLEYYRDPGSVYNRDLESLLFRILNTGQNLVCLFLSIRLLGRKNDHRRIILNQWIKFIYVFLSVYSAFNLLNTAYYYFTHEKLVDFYLWSIPLFASLIYSVAYMACVNPEKIFLSSWKIWSGTQDLSAVHNPEMAIRMDELMRINKLYLDPDLNSSDVAAKLGISARTLSRVLNDIGQTFNDFVNRYRVDEAKKQILESYEEATLLAIALNSGFSSKSSFNRVFKQYTGLTPTEFLQSRSLKDSLSA